MGLRRQMMAGGGLPPTVWDATAKGTNVVLSNANLDATKTGGGWESVYGTNGKSAGKWQFEIAGVSGGGFNVFAGIADKTNLANVLATYIGNNGASVIESVGYWGNGRIYRNLTAGAGETAVSAWGDGEIITVTLDLTVPEVKFYLNGATLAGTVSLPAGKTWFPATSMQSDGKTRLDVSGLTYPKTGFTDWG